MLAENPTMNLMQQCGQLLQITFKSGNQDERKLAEQTLKQLSQKGDQFLEALISIITMNDSSGKHYLIIADLNNHRRGSRTTEERCGELFGDSYKS